MRKKEYFTKSLVLRLYPIFFVLVIIVITSSFYLWTKQFDFTGYAVKDSVLTLKVNDYVDMNSIIVFKTQSQKIQKKVSELNSKLVNGVYFIGTLSFNVDGLGLNLKEGEIITASLTDNEKIIAITELNYTIDKHKL
ncbi:hypothetical protein HYT57_01320 [Candidatus Woesearchaeota archaeon]|nr:hypothetical protein [Candidatus Woesearchaeota archaeon]